MDKPLSYQLLADAVLLLHFAVVLFVVGGLAAVVVGNLRAWRWVNSLWFRLAHLAAIGVVVVQSLLGKLCPLTVLESWLRERAGASAYTTSFIENWVQRVLFYEAPFWVFTLSYMVFGLLVVVAWWRYPPRMRSQHRQASAADRAPSSALSNALIPMLEQSFSHVPMRLHPNARTLAVFTPNHLEIDEVAILDDGDELTVNLGNYGSHIHFRNDDDSLSDSAKAHDVAQQCVNFLRELF
ncbi:MAG: DUF2784 domain-containing protein [bacterium]|jgi:hypothetical protein|nr:DUF2784 domain-containing protein [Burkholderiales bacterium]